MPEGDTILHHALAIRPVLEGRIPVEVITAPKVPFRAERLTGRRVERIDTRGKNLFVHFDGDLVIHSHLRMTGSWAVYRIGERWRRGRSRAWLVLRTDTHEVVQFDGPVLELMTTSRMRFDQRLAGLGPDVLAERFDAPRFLRRLREDDPARPVGDALLDQRNVAGLGNIWKAEGCWEAGIDPWRPVRAISDAEAIAVVEAVRPRMLRSAHGRGYDEHPRVYGMRGRPCPRCGEPITARGQGDANRTTYWCPACQR